MPGIPRGQRHHRLRQRERPPGLPGRDRVADHRHVTGERRLATLGEERVQAGDCRVIHRPQAAPQRRPEPAREVRREHGPPGVERVQPEGLGHLRVLQRRAREDLRELGVLPAQALRGLHLEQDLLDLHHRRPRRAGWTSTGTRTTGTSAPLESSRRAPCTACSSSPPIFMPSPFRSRRTAAAACPSRRPRHRPPPHAPRLPAPAPPGPAPPRPREPPGRAW